MRSFSASFSNNRAVRSGPWLSNTSSKTDCSDSDHLSPLPEDEAEREP